MFVIDEAKLPPPRPVIAARTSSVSNDADGVRKNAVETVGMSSSSALTTVQLRPPKRATARVYGSRTAEPSPAGSDVSRNFCPAAVATSVLIPYCPLGRKSTKTDHSTQIENPMCSQSTENTRF